MKKLLAIYVLFICALPIIAQEDLAGTGEPVWEEQAWPVDPFWPEEPALAEDDQAWADNPAWPAEPLLPEEPTLTEKTKKGKGDKQIVRVRNRGFELVYLDTHVNVSNNFLAANEIFKETAVIDISDLYNGFKIDFGVQLTPMAFNIDVKDHWGFGMELAKVSAFGNVGITGSLFQITKEADKEKFGVGGAVFVDIGVPAFFRVKKLKVNLRTAYFIPLIYTEPNIEYTYKENSDGIYVKAKYDLKIYSPMLDMLENPDKPTDVNSLVKEATSSFGLDFSAGAEYPLFSWLHVGSELINIPLKPAVVKKYMQIKGQFFLDSSKINFIDMIGSENYELPEDAFGASDNFEPLYKTGEKFILRPFTFLTYATYYPFSTPLISLKGVLGFSINPLYAQVFGIEVGANFCLDLANIFVTTVGMNYRNRVWRHSIDFILNFRAFELDLGVSVESPDFGKSFQGAGAGVNLALKFGW